MNDGAGKIEIIKPFGEGFEMMQKILFKPFNFEKWLVIGFAAFLSGHFSAGGLNFPFGNFPKRTANQGIASQGWDQWKPWLPVVITVFVLLMLILIVLFSWLRARGTFIFTDCIARSRAAIVEPWMEYRLEGNSYFCFLLLVFFGSLIIFGLLCLLGFTVFGYPGQGFGNLTMTPLFIIFFGLLSVLWLAFAFFFGLTSYFMVPLMYVRRCRAAEAFGRIAALVLENPGPFILFCLFGICLLIGAGMISGIATCVTCCVAALPYIGTVILLPVFVCLRAFGLCFIRQFGADYDVWSVVPQSTPMPPPELPPAPA